MGDGSIGASSELTNSLLNERALGVTGAEEREVNDEQDPASLGESDSGQQEADKQGDFKGSDDTHASIVVLLDEAANGLGESGLLGGGLGVGRAWRGGAGLLGLDGWDQVHAAVGGDVED